jgi:hypothetical protein
MRHFALLSLAGCASAAIAPEPAAPPAHVVAAPPAIDPRFVPAMNAIVASYAQWPRSDEKALWAPALCTAPQRGSGAFMSRAENGPHVQKLYAVRLGTEPGMPRVFVKEAFAPELLESDPGYTPGKFNPTVRAPDGKMYRMGAPAGLFVVIQTDTKTDTDDGWIYGTTDPNGTITSLGRVKTCMGCHVTAPQGRVLTPGLMHSNDG